MHKFIKNTLQPDTRFAIFFNAVAKSTASREKLIQSKANSTPNRAFFVRNVRTPKENALSVVLSMVGRKGQPFAVGCFSFDGSFSPLYVLPPAVRSLAVSLYNQSKEIAKMIYKFLLLGDTRLTVRIRAKTEQEARSKIKFTSPALCIARFRENPTACTTPTTAQGGIYA